MMSPYASLLAQIQGGGNGMMAPGAMPNGAPQLPQIQHPAGAGMAPPTMPGATPPQSPSSGVASGASSMFSNPMMMGLLPMLMKGQGGGQSPMSGQPGGPAFNAPGMQLPWQSPSEGAPAAPQLPWQQMGGDGQGGIMAMLSKMFQGGGSGF